jgi:adenosylhomocysteinase
MEISSSKIENPALAEQGKQRLVWTSHNMPILAQIRETFQKTKPFDGLRIGICLHVEPKTAIWVQTLMAGGAKVSITGSPRTTKDDTAAALVADGVNVYAWNSETFDDHLNNIGRVLSDEPNLIADNGADLHAFIHEKPEYQHLQKTIIGATEETTSGATRLREEVGTFYCPTLVINDTRAKRIIENRYGVGHGVVDALMRGVGAHVTVVDIDPLAQLEAHVEGFQTASLEDALPNADIVITVTGRNGALGVPEFEQMKDGALVCNAGHFEFELDLAGLKSITTDSQEIEANIDEITLNSGKKIFLLGQGNLINLAAADGNPIEVMDLGLALQSLSLAYHVEHPNTLAHEPQNLPYEIEKKVAELALKAWT